MSKALALLGLSLAVVLTTLGARAVAHEGESGDEGVATRDLAIHFVPEDERDRPVIIDELAPSTVLTITATGFGEAASGVIRQCAHATAACGNDLSVRFDDRGRAVFQYLVTDRIGTVMDGDEPCRLDTPGCIVELRVGREVTVIDTIFVDSAPAPGRLEVTPRTDLRIGDTVAVTATGFPPGRELTATVCAGRATRGDRCGAPAPELTLTIGPEGTAEGDMTLDLAEVGESGVACGRRTTCRVVVDSHDTGVFATPVALAFRTGPGTGYDAGRLAAGLAAAVTLAALAVWLVRSTDWQPPREADGSVIDDALFADLDLEAELFGEDPPSWAATGTER